MNAPTPECEQANALLVDLVYGELDGPVKGTVERHVPGCTRCQADLAALQGTRRVMGAAEQVPAPERGLESLLAFAEQHAARQQEAATQRPAWLRWAMGIVPVGLAAAVGLMLFGQGTSGPTVVDHSGSEIHGQAEAVVAQAPAPSPERAVAAATPPTVPAPAPDVAALPVVDLAPADAKVESPAKRLPTPSAGKTAGLVAAEADKADRVDASFRQAGPVAKQVAAHAAATKAMVAKDERRSDTPATDALAENKPAEPRQRGAVLGGMGGAASGAGMANEEKTNGVALASQEHEDRSGPKGSANLGRAGDDLEAGEAGGSFKKAKKAESQGHLALAAKPTSVAAAPGYGAPETAAPAAVAMSPPPPPAPSAAPVARKEVDSRELALDADGVATGASRASTESRLANASQPADGWTTADQTAAQGDHATAAQRYRAVFDAAPRGPRAAEALLRAGEEQGRAGRPLQAVETLQSVGRYFPGSALAPRAFAEAAQWARSANDERLAETIEGTLISTYPGSPEAARAEPQRRQLPAGAVAAPKAAARPAPARDFDDEKAAEMSK